MTPTSKSVNTLQVENTFDPYYAGRDRSASRLRVHRRDGDKVIESAEIEAADATDFEARPKAA